MRATFSAPRMEIVTFKFDLEATTMKQYFVVLALFMLAAGLCASPAFAQDTGSVKGVCKDVDGKPIVGATVEWVNTENGRKYDIKTNSKGEYFSLGIALGHYKVTLLGTDGKEIFHYNGFTASSDESTLDFDMQKEAANAAKGSGLTPEQIKQQQEQAANIAKENMTIKSLNEKLAAAKTAADAGDLDTAIAQMTDATKMDPNRDLLWAKLGDYEATSAAKQTDSAEKAKRYDASVTDYQKAVDLKQKALDAAPQRPPDATKVLAQYYNNLGKAAAQLGKTDDAVKAYNQAAQLDPAGAGMYYFNLGAILTNANTTSNGDMRKAAAQAFDKAIAADPARADAYYWKGTNLIGGATLQGDKMVAPPGTAEAFQKYLELAPTGPHAEEAKAMLQGLGAPVETSYGTKKKGTKN
ncbi:MAG: carboxypeptidase regulatory-like domain-containing protein [Terriglobales bacterium]|jgi:tetratricopeptide (TPR) repeat protein